MTIGTLRSTLTPVAPVITNPEPWIEDAACRQHNPKLWDTYGGQLSDENRRALGICRTCPVKALCRDFADRTEQPSLAFNIFGGETPAQRIARRAKTRPVCTDCGGVRRWSKYAVIRESGLCTKCWSLRHPWEWSRLPQKKVAA